MSNEEKKKQMKLTLRQVIAIGTFLVLLGVVCNFALGPLLKHLGVFEKSPLVFSMSGLPFLVLGNWFLISLASKTRKAELSNELTIREDLQLGAPLARRLLDSLRANNDLEDRFPMEIDTFGETPRWNHQLLFKLYVTNDAPPGSIQKVSGCLNMQNIRLLKKERINTLVIIGGEPTEHMDSLVKLLGAFNFCFKSHAYDYHNTNMYVCTSTTNISNLMVLTRLEGLLKGFIYIPYNESCLTTLLEYTKILNMLYPKDYTVLDGNRIFMLPEMRAALTSKEIKLLKTRWEIQDAKDVNEIERWKGKHIRKLQKFID